MLWILFALMCLGAIAFAIRPLLTDQPRLNVLTGVSVVVFVTVAAGVYYIKGSPNVPSGRTEQTAAPDDVMAMVEGLAARLEQQPDDINGWKMLGRSYMALGNFEGAAAAFETAVELENAQNPDTLIRFGFALTQGGATPEIPPRAISAFENALALAPNNPEALFWSGFAAVARGDTLLAADRWERLLDNNPPPEIRPQIEAQIAVWRGESPPESLAPQAAAPAEEATIISASLTVSDAARAALPEEASVFVIARDPAQPSPPIAVTRRLLSELPSVVDLDDGDSMIPGRELSGFAEIELVARVSLSGEPAAQPGDWFGAAIVRPADQSEITLTIDEQVE